MNLKLHIQTALTAAAENSGFSSSHIIVSDSKDEKHGDLSSNLPLMLSKEAKRPPMKIAEEIIAHIVKDEFIDDVFPSPPGFINFKVADTYYQSLIKTILKNGNDHGKTIIGEGKKANVEFVSANPTGPLTVGHGRNAVLGDTVSNILEFHGFDVTREYYFNDAGRQMRLLGQSVEARYNELAHDVSEFPEDGYQGAYIIDIAQQILEDHGNELKTGDPIFKETAEEAIFENIKNALHSLGIDHNVFSNEKTIYESGEVEKVVETLKDKDLVYEAEDAVWFKTTSLGMDQDRVLIKSSGEPTYRLPDMAYHVNKIERGFDLIIDVLGADHVDTYPDVIAAVEALGHSTDHFKLLIHQFVTLLKGGQKVKMSTRKAEFVTLQQLVDDVGVDVVRYFFIMRSMNSHLNFDLDLAADQSEKNPVFYLQYAHARICNIIKHGESGGVSMGTDFDASLISSKPELDLLKCADQFPDVMETALNTLEPQSISNYLQELGTRFHKFYGECKVITDDISLSSARIGLINAVQNILSSGLTVLGISAPKRM